MSVEGLDSGPRVCVTGTKPQSLNFFVGLYGEWNPGSSHASIPPLNRSPGSDLCLSLLHVFPEEHLDLKRGRL